MTYARCPECERPANIIDRFWLMSTSGSIEHLKIACLGGHWSTPRAKDAETFSAPVPQTAPADAAAALRSAA